MELLMVKLRVGIRARFEYKIKSGRAGNLTNAIWEEKKKNDWGGYIRTEKEVFQ